MLTAKEEKFCEAIITGLNQTDAYKVAYETRNMLPTTINNDAYQLMQHNDIATRLTELRSAIHAGIAWTFEKGISEVETNLTNARVDRQHSAANKATEQALKLSGLLVDQPASHQSITMIQVNLTGPDAKVVDVSATKVTNVSPDEEQGL